MKSICVSMALSELVLNSYLKRVFKGKLLKKKTCKVIYFPQENLTKKNWTVGMFKNFCSGTVSNKDNLRLYKANLTKRF
jgi:hypothetical protein